MNREQFFAQLATCDEEHLKKVLWNLYWRGSAKTREHIEAELDPAKGDRRARASNEPPDPQWVLDEVREFAALARSGAYLGGDRRVLPKERSRWRFTFQRLVRDAQGALASEDVGTAATAVAELVDLACEMRGREYVRSEDPVDAARVVVSDLVASLWGRVCDHDGFAAFAQRAAPQLVRWESKYGWTRSGRGQISRQETSLASVLARMLPAADMWTGIADRYLDALDQVARDEAAKPKRSWQSPASERKERTKELAEWHLLLVDRLMFSDTEDRLDRLAGHPALGGAELTFLRAQLAYRRGDADRARELVHESLEELPGHPGFLDFAAEIGAVLP